MAENQAAETIDVCKEKYPPSPELDPKEFPQPKEPDDKYFEKLPKDKLQAISEKKEGLKITANETMQIALAAAEDEKQLAQSAYKFAQKKFETAKNLLVIQSKNRKKQYWRDYRQSLRDSLPKNQSITQLDDIEKHVFDDKKAIFIAKLNKDLASEELEYRKKYQQFYDELAAAENSWKLATNTYDAATCSAKAQEFIDLYDADVIWRQDLSDALEPK